MDWRSSRKRSMWSRIIVREGVCTRCFMKIARRWIRSLNIRWPPMWSVVWDICTRTTSFMAVSKGKAKWHFILIERETFKTTLKRKSLHFDEMFITGCTGSCQNDNFQCSQWWKFRQNDDIFVSVYVHGKGSTRGALNTLRPRQNVHRFADDTFKHIFLNENVRISIKISLKFVPKGPINNNPVMVQIMAWRRSVLET